MKQWHYDIERLKFPNDLTFHVHTMVVFLALLLKVGSRHGHWYDFVAVFRPMGFDEQSIDQDTQNGSDVRPNNWNPEPRVVFVTVK